MDTRLLENFLVIAREENMTNAAKRLHISQSALSRQMAELEREVGKPLFVRTNKSTELNDDGRLFSKRAEEMVSLMNRTLAEFHSTGQSLRGEIRIGAGESPVIRYVADVIKEFHEQYPEVHFYMNSGTADNIMERLRQGIFDIGILVEPRKRAEFEYRELPVQDTFGVLLRTEDAFAQKAALTAMDLTQMPLVASPRTILLKDKLEKWLRASAGLEMGDLTITAFYNLLYNASFLVEAGVGNALCIDNLGNASQNGSLCFRPLTPEMHLKLMLVWKKSPAMSRVNEMFLDALQKKFDSLEK